uniref:Hook microtubule tethering protein 2 n=1 Tax=Oncorhynchus mykiss TaxID=8022 RepID=A0A8C7RHF6_ONCMY
MSLDKAKLCDSLLNWLQTFQVPSCTSKQDLMSGVAIAHVLHKIDPSWFNEAWLGRIKEESEANWRLKVQYEIEGYNTVLGHQVADVHLPDINLIGEFGDVTELGKLVQLVLGCAVSCEKKQGDWFYRYSSIAVSFTCLSWYLSLALSLSLSFSLSLVLYLPLKYYFLSEEVEAKEDLGQRCRDLEHQVAVLEEKSSLQVETQSLREKLSLSDPQDASTTITGKKLLLLQSQMEQLQEENYRLENSRDDMRVRGEILERDVLDLTHRNDELTSLAQEAQSLKDEMDILRHSSDRVSRLEALVETYKRKLEDLGDLRRQVRLLEERNTVYMQRTCELEEELRRANSVRTQLDTYKRQVHELHTKHLSEALKAEKWQFEYKNLQDKYDALLKEKERLISERDTLRETNDELRCAQVQQKGLNQPGEETVVRLQSENKMLCVQEESYRQRLVEVQGQLEESQRSQNTLETQNRLNQQQISELRSQVEDLQKALQEQGSKAEDSSLLKKKLEEHLEKLHEAHSDLQKKREVIDDLEPKADGNMAKKIDELQEILKKKDEDMKLMEQRYKRYVEKARTVIKTLDPKQPPLTVSPDVQALKNQLTERDRKIQHLEHDYEKSRSRHDQEEKLIISAWYNMGMALHQKVVGERSGPSNQAQSFLAQQRQSTHARRGLAARHQPR